MRYFISIELPDNVKDKIFNSFKKLKESKVCYGNFVKKDNLHLTLRFLDDVPEEKIESIKKALEEIDFRQFPIESGRVGFFPNEKYIEVLWIDLIASDFYFLKDEIDEKLEGLGFPKNGKEFKTHVTVARIKGINDKQKFFNKINEISPKKMFFIANQFSLVKSVLERNGPKYETLKEFPMRMR